MNEWRDGSREQPVIHGELLIEICKRSKLMEVQAGAFGGLFPPVARCICSFFTRHKWCYLADAQVWMCVCCHSDGFQGIGIFTSPPPKPFLLLKGWMKSLLGNKSLLSMMKQKAWYGNVSKKLYQSRLCRFTIKLISPKHQGLSSI